MHVLILGARAPVCLEWARAFRAANWEVTVADSMRWPLSRWSVATDRYVRLPEPRVDSRLWADSLLEVIKANRVDLVMPTCEEVFYLAYWADYLPCRVLTVGLPTLDELHHKYRFSRVIANLCVNTPESHLVRSARELSAWAEREGRWVLKPAYSRFASRTLVCPDKHALNRVRPTDDDPWVAQRFIEGQEFCSWSFLLDGKVQAHCAYEPRYRVGAGAGVWLSIIASEHIENFVAQFGAMTGYTGQIGFDFIQDVNGRYWVIECNPRATSGVHMFYDQLGGLAGPISGKAGGAPVKPDRRPQMIAFAMLLFVAPKKVFSKAFWRDYRAADDVIIRGGDWRPVVAQLLGLFEIVWRAVRRRSCLRAAATADIEWNGEELGRRSCD